MEDYIDNISPETDVGIGGQLASLIYVFGINKNIWLQLGDDLDKEQPRLNINDKFSDIKFSDRRWEFINLRAGFGNLHSYAEIAVMFEVTRARSQQINTRVVESIYRNFEPLLHELNMLEEMSCPYWPFIVGLSIDDALSAYSQAMVDTGWVRPSLNYLKRLLLIFRLLSRCKDFLVEVYPNLSYLSCIIEPMVLKDPGLQSPGDIQKQHEIEQNRAWTYEELAEFILREANIPLHYTEVIKRAEEMNKRPDVSAKAIHNVLGTNHDKFVRTGRGMFSLTSLGAKPADNLVDQIVLAMQALGKPSTSSEIWHKVAHSNSAKETSFKMFLSMHPRFYRSIDNTFGLRACLPDRSKQTLRTPKGLIEAPDSILRVERAQARGYNVEAIVARDRAKP